MVKIYVNSCGWIVGRDKKASFVTQNSKREQNRFRMNVTKNLRVVLGKQSKQVIILTRLEFKRR